MQEQRFHCWYPYSPLFHVELQTYASKADMSALRAELNQIETYNGNAGISNRPIEPCKQCETKLWQNDCDIQQQKAIYDIIAPIFLYEETTTQSNCNH